MVFKARSMNNFVGTISRRRTNCTNGKLISWMIVSILIAQSLSATMFFVARSEPRNNGDRSEDSDPMKILGT